MRPPRRQSRGSLRKLSDEEDMLESDGQFSSASSESSGAFVQETEKPRQGSLRAARSASSTSAHRLPRRAAGQAQRREPGAAEFDREARAQRYARDQHGRSRHTVSGNLRESRRRSAQELPSAATDTNERGERTRKRAPKRSTAGGEEGVHNGSDQDEAAPAGTVNDAHDSTAKDTSSRGSNSSSGSDSSASSAGSAEDPSAAGDCSAATPKTPASPSAPSPEHQAGVRRSARTRRTVTRPYDEFVEHEAAEAELARKKRRVQVNMSSSASDDDEDTAVSTNSSDDGAEEASSSEEQAPSEVPTSRPRRRVTPVARFSPVANDGSGEKKRGSTSPRSKLFGKHRSRTGGSRNSPRPRRVKSRNLMRDFMKSHTYGDSDTSSSSGGRGRRARRERSSSSGSGASSRSSSTSSSGLSIGKSSKSKRMSRRDSKKRDVRAAKRADIAPLEITDGTDWNAVGGLAEHVRALQEMVYLPLMYPDVFEHFQLRPPRGVLFYGPPGTGKTLVARAMASACTRDGNKVTFFMRKGADCLSKWVGEAERQLRLLFQEAQRLQPSIIFFDEIDGLAPVRSAKQDQIHSSIVSTLLALMDGLDSRGQVVVVGATNRVDAIDPALRRPGRFDRELMFPLPDEHARREILDIHTRKISPPPAPGLLDGLARRTAGFGGADLHALCCEAALHAFRRRFPIAYTSTLQYKLPLQHVHVSQEDFLAALAVITPAAQRQSTGAATPLPDYLRPLWNRVVRSVAAQFHRQAKGLYQPLRGLPSDLSIRLQREKQSDAHENVYWTGPASVPGQEPPSLQLSPLEAVLPAGRRGPRLCICSTDMLGLSRVGTALLFETSLPVVSLAMEDLLAPRDGSSPEATVRNAFREACSRAPAVLYVPLVHAWQEHGLGAALHSLAAAMCDLTPSTPVAVVATAVGRAGAHIVPRDILDLLGLDTVDTGALQASDVAAFFQQLVDAALALEQPGALPASERRAPNADMVKLTSDAIAPASLSSASDLLPLAARVRRETLRIAPPPPAPAPSPRSIKRQRDREQHALRELRMVLREVLYRVMQDRKYSMFVHAVDPEEVPDYYTIVERPMHLSAMMEKTDAHEYATLASFLHDVDLIVQNALVYNPDDEDGRRIKSRARALRDFVDWILHDQFDRKLLRRIVARTDALANRQEEPDSARDLPRSAPQPASRAPGPLRAKDFDSVPLVPPQSSRFRISPEVPGARRSSRIRGDESVEVADVGDLEKALRAGRSGNEQPAPNPTTDSTGAENDDHASIENAFKEKRKASTPGQERFTGHTENPATSAPGEPRESIEALEGKFRGLLDAEVFATSMTSMELERHFSAMAAIVGNSKTTARALEGIISYTERIVIRA